MQKLTKFLNDFLPFNGSKTALGGWMVLFSVLEHFVPGLNIATLAQFLADNPSKTGMAAVIIGLIHKELKRRAPATPEV